MSNKPLRRLVKGQSIEAIPGDTWNGFVETAERVRQSPVGGNGTGVQPGPGHQLDVVAINDSGGDLTADFPIVRLTEPVFTIAENPDTPREGVFLKCNTPDSQTGSKFVVLQSPCAEDAAAVAVISGLTWCKVDVDDVSHTRATAIDGDNEKLKSGTAGQRIIWKEPTGTGEKWALILVTPGGAEDEVVQAMLIKSLEPATIDGVAGTLTPSAVVDDAVVLLENPTEGNDPATPRLDDADEIIFYDAVNRAWLRELTAGDGQESEIEGMFNPTPKIVYGYLGTRTVTIEEVDVQVPTFVITDVQNPPRIIRGQTTAAVAAVDPTWDMDTLTLLWGDPLPALQTEVVDVVNPDDWDGDDNEVSLAIEKPDGDKHGLDLGCVD